MIKLIQFPRPANRPSFSPFCLKLETYFKLAGVPFENSFTVSTGKTTKKKLPVILDDGNLIEDSTFIIEYLNKKYQIDLDGHLTSEQKAIAKAFQWLCEKSIVDIVVYFRWVDPNNWPKFRDVIFYGAPWLIKATVANGMASSIKKTLYKHGMGRFSEAEKMKILDDNLNAISTYLGNKKYFFGDQVSSIDATIYSHLVQVRPRDVVHQFNGVLDKYPNLVNYLKKFETTHWPEFV